MNSKNNSKLTAGNALGCKIDQQECPQVQNSELTPPNSKLTAGNALGCKIQNSKLTPILEVKSLCKTYKDYSQEYKRILSWFGLGFKPAAEHHILKNINFSIAPGEAVGIVGQNGAGKSTLLKIITGTLKPSEGSVHIDGRISAILELGMGFHPDLTGRQNTYHTAGLMGFTQAQIDDVIDEIEAFAEIEEYFDQPLRTYSSGMQARVAFAVATAFRPEILIVDEALSVGDAYFQAKCYERISDFKKQGTTLLLVTHAISDVVRHCDRALLIKKGFLVLDGSPKDVSNMYFDELFGKGRQKENAEIKHKTINLAIEESKNFNDVFHTRLGYRKEEYRWGNGGAKIIDFSIVSNGVEYPPQIESTVQTDFYIKVHFEKDFNDITIGFLIKTHDGVFLYGTNSFLTSHGKHALDAKENEIKLFKFSLPMTLNSGHYLVSFGISTGPQENLEPLDRRYDAILLNIERPMAFWGMVDLQAEFKMENIHE